MPPVLPLLVRQAMPPIPPALVRHAEGPADSAHLSHGRASEDDSALRPSSEMPGWLARYERDLHLSDAALESRRQALHKGGTAMLLRMFPQRFHEDLQGPYLEAARLLDRPGPPVTAVGDGHLGNFGTVLDRNGSLVWSINDYDQCAPGKPEDDLCRLGADLGRVCRGRDRADEKTDKLVAELTDAYRQELKRASMPRPLGLTLDESDGPVRHLLKRAARHTPEELLEPWTEPAANGLRFKTSSNERLKPVTEEQSARIDALLAQAGVQVQDRACRLEAGGSSIGLDRFYLLAARPGGGLPALLELKQLLPAALCSPTPDPSATDPEVMRTALRDLHAPQDGWQRVLQLDGKSYLLRERQPARDSIDPDKLDFEELRCLARQAGQILARAHAASPGGCGALLSWIGKDQDTMTQRLSSFSRRYAHQLESDATALSLR